MTSFQKSPFDRPVLPREAYQEFDSLEEVMRASYDFFQIKYDGIYSENRCFNGQRQVLSRTGNLKAELTIPNANAPQAILLGEHMMCSQWSQDPSRKGRTYMWDILEAGLSDFAHSCTYAQRYRHLVQYVASTQAPDISVVSCYPIAKLPEYWASIVKNQSVEGVVLRNWKSLYGDRSLGKLKRVVTDDFFITGFLEGDGKYSNTLGSLEVSQFNEQGVSQKVMNVSGGLSDEQRNTIWFNQPLYYLHVVECTGKGRMDSGALRHSSVVQFRADKLPAQCRLKTSL
jgi:ATP-dependent DNA ligase